MTSPTPARAVLAAAALAALAACGSSGTTTTSTSATPNASATAKTSVAAEPSSAVTVNDAWCKAADTGMTGCFATLVNRTDAAIQITAGTSPAAGMVELHETVKNANGQMQMQPAAGGFTIAAAGQLVLEPGSNHIMLMQLTSALKNGDPVAITLTTSAGPVPVTFTARAFPGANESYQPAGSATMTHS